MRHRSILQSIINFSNVRRGLLAAASFVLVFVLCGFTVSKECKPIKINVLAVLKLPKWYHEGLYFDGKNIWVNNGKNGKTWVINTSDGSVVREIAAIATFTEAITPKTKDIFFVTDWDAKRVYTADIKNDGMSEISSVSLEPARPAGALWNGSNLFIVTWTRSITGTKFNLLKMDDKFNILSATRIKNIAEPAHLAWDGKYLWLSCWFSQRVYKVDTEKLEILGYFRSPAAMTTGIAWDGKFLWVTGTYSDLYKMEVQG